MTPSSENTQRGRWSKKLRIAVLTAILGGFIAAGMIGFISVLPGSDNAGSFAALLVPVFVCSACAVGVILAPILNLVVRQPSRYKTVLALVLGLILSGVIAEGGATLYFTGDRRGFESMRARLAGDQLPPSPYLGQPYLLYVVRPGTYAENNFHNEQGYRGKAVDMQRTKNVSRVLCLGGSTTYGVRTQNPDQAYPAQLEKILSKHLPAGVQGVEVINGGLPNGTTAELLTHYHFKFHYFKPDLVVINTGGNDAGMVDATELASKAKYYQPDYSHRRQPLHLPQPLSPIGRAVVKSRFASWLISLLLYGREPGNAAIERPPGLPPPTVWHPAARQPGLAASIPDSELAFTHNLKTLISLIQGDQGQVLLVPFRLAPGFEKEDWAKAELRHERILNQVAEEEGLLSAPFPASVISPQNWMDECHLNAAGCQEKADHIAPLARQLLWPAATDGISQTAGGSSDRAQ